LAEGRPLAEQLGIDPQRPDSFAFVAKGRPYIKSEAALRIASELPYWRWTWVFHFIPQVIRDEVYDLVARNRYRWFGRREVRYELDEGVLHYGISVHTKPRKATERR